MTRGRGEGVHEKMTNDGDGMEKKVKDNKPNCAISSDFAVIYCTNFGLDLAGWLSTGLRPNEAVFPLFLF